MHAELKTRDALGPLGPVEEKNAPDVLYTAGDISLLTEGSRVAIVGSRKATPDGIKRARAVTRALVDQGIIVVSGLAEGIDTVAHKTAIEEGGRTIAVLGTPLSKAYPTKNAGLLEEIKRNHLAISQFPEGYPGKGENFPRRNRTMALICDATIVIEASEKSGTRHQGWEAIRLGRDLYLLENVATDPNLTWPKQLIEYGAQILRRENLPDILLDIPNYTAGGVCVPSSYEYGTFANYSPRGTSDLSKKSRRLCGAVKAGKLHTLGTAIPHLRDPKADVLQPFLGPDVTLVPAPRSAPLSDGALWPAKVICDVLHGHGFGQEVQTYLTRVKAVPRSSSSPAADRPLVPVHMESIEAERPFFMPDKITIVDDVLTMGRTSFTCAELLRAVCPDAEIRIFAMIRTQGLQDDIDQIVDPATGVIVGYPSGKTHRDP